MVAVTGEDMVVTEAQAMGHVATRTAAMVATVLLRRAIMVQVVTGLKDTGEDRLFCGRPLFIPARTLF